MAEHTWEELRGMTVARLREIGAELGDDAPRGYTQMHKGPLVEALCRAYGIDAHPHHEVVGVNKARIKSRIRHLKTQRAVALDSGDRAELKQLMREIHRLKHRLRKAMV